ncbi:MAG: DUF4384 domain-containing protein [Mariprofundales bacterium]
MKYWSYYTLGILVIFALMPLAIAEHVADGVQYTIVEAEGMACMGDDKSRKQTQNAAKTDAKRNAAEQTATQIKSSTEIKDMELQRDMVQAVSNASVKLLETLSKQWQEEKGMGACYYINVRAEVVPKPVDMQRINKKYADDPSAPLSVQVSTEKQQYAKGELVNIYIRGNKPFYGRLVYQDASGDMLQLLPNPYRQQN